MSNSSLPKIAIVGAGISGLVAAKRFEEENCRVTLFEQRKEVGGRVATDIYNGYPLDRGFQVLLTAYPEARRHLNYEKLQLRLFRSGARVFKGGKSFLIGDPLRDFDFFLPTLSFPLAGLRDKWKIFQLNRSLRSKSLDEIFSSPEISTIEYLKSQGFSKAIIEHFFRPFFGGIFLEPDLSTSSRMFEFVYKMFGQGYAALPAHGISEIPKQLNESLTQTEVRLNTRITSREGSTLLWEDGQGQSGEDTFDSILYAGSQLQTEAKEIVQWNSCQNFYFEYLQGNLEERMIGLIADPNALINNIHLVPNMDGKASEMLSVTVLKATTEDSKVQAEAIRAELRKFCGIEAGKLTAHYSIEQALPVVQGQQYDLQSGGYKRGDVQFVAGDYLLYPSLNAAMYSGEQAAEACIEMLKVK